MLWNFSERSQMLHIFLTKLTSLEMVKVEVLLGNKITKVLNNVVIVSFQVLHFQIKQSQYTSEFNGYLSMIERT